MTHNASVRFMSVYPTLLLSYTCRLALHLRPHSPQCCWKSEKSQSSRENSAGLLLCYNIQQSSPRVCMDTNISKWSVDFFKIKQRFQQTGSISKIFVYRESKVEPEEMFLLFFIQSCWISRLAFVLLVCSEKLTRKHQYEWWGVLNDLQMCEKGYCEQNSHICIVMVALWFTCWKPFFFFCAVCF